MALSPLLTATYRLQFHRGFPLSAGQQVLPYLQELGVSDVYASPIYAARSGSLHGYDVLDHERVNPELGGEPALSSFLDELSRRDLGVVLDVVPNHTCIAGSDNRFWTALLEEGLASPHADLFDIDWAPPRQELTGKVLLPVLEAQYGHVLETDLQVQRDGDLFFVAGPGGARFPLDMRTWPAILDLAGAWLKQQGEALHLPLAELESIGRALRQMGPRRALSSDEQRETDDEKKIVRRRMADLLVAHPVVEEAIGHALTTLNGRRGAPRSYDALESLLAAQPYRLAHWRVAAHEINYRRFFDINELAAIRVEIPAVFDRVHTLPLRLAAHPSVRGFRIDHVDGLRDPQQYLDRLRDGWRRVRGADAPPGYVVVEKILGGDEDLPEAWATEGTTGYEFITLVAGALVDEAGADELRELAAQVTRRSHSFPQVAYESKRQILRGALVAELTVLARRLDRISEQHRYTRDFTLPQLQEALGEVIACFPVYRTYLNSTSDEMSGRDRSVVRAAVDMAKRRNQVIDASVFDFVGSVLAAERPDGLEPAQLEERREFALRVQQLTGPAMAKGVEDTSFYRYLPLVAVNEVGGDPEKIGAPLSVFHQGQRRRLARMPKGLSATATHDTKRGEDTRARLYVLSEIVPEWRAAVRGWFERNAAARAVVAGHAAPDPAEEYLLYQTLFGSWPVDGLASEPGYAKRVATFMQKARAEAKDRTSWMNPNRAYEAGADQFVTQLLDPQRSAAFIADMDAFVARHLPAGLWTGLAQLLLKAASPGVPDFYQGCELWDFSLVDPDNRRPVDFNLRRQMLAGLREDFEKRRGGAIQEWAGGMKDGRLKMWLTTRALHLRRQRAATFAHGDYQPLEATGPRARHVVGFVRGGAAEASGPSIVVLTGRFFGSLCNTTSPPAGNIWEGTVVGLPEAHRGRRYRNVITGEDVQQGQNGLDLGRAFALLPMALLEDQDG